MTYPASQGKTNSPISIMDRALKVLHLEDNPADRDVVQQWLREQNFAAEFTDVCDETEFNQALQSGTFDIILSDMTLPGYGGLEALRQCQEKYPHIPFVFVTGSIGEDAAIETMKHGATDYVLKDRLSRLIPAVQRAIREAEQEEKNRRSEAKLRWQAALLDKAQDAIMVKDLEDRIVYWNKGAERLYGWKEEEILNSLAAKTLPGDPARFAEARQHVLEHGTWTGELTVATRGGVEVSVESRWNLLADAPGTPKTILIIDTDITEKKGLETRYLRAQRLDSIGSLASGIAHDLNNALAPVMMGSELLRDCEDAASRQKFLDIIDTNTQRATQLVKQILNFARGGECQSGPINVRGLLKEMGKMVQDTFRKSISFSLKLPEKPLWAVHGDTTEIHQVLLNLCVNARDAMPQGGNLLLAAENFRLSPDESLSFNARPGTYVMILVSDTGTGIPPEVLPRIFEPFFTTKRGGAGTGLGLATVGSIVKRHGGFLDIQTEAGKGTTFKVFLPATGTVEKSPGETHRTALPAGHGELIFLIDDEAALLEMTKSLLESFGYRVLTAADGMQGVERFIEHKDEIKLVITDSDMPNMDGWGAIQAMRELNSNLPVILASGTKNDTEELRRRGSDFVKTLSKPYSLEQLLKAVDSGLHH